MRIATANGFENAINNLQDRQQRLSESQTQLTSGKRVNNASDDPTAAARAERASAVIARGESDKRSVDASRNVMSISLSAMDDAVEMLQKGRETLVAAGNGTYSDGERKALAIKMVNIRNQLLSVANRADGGGGYVFGGQGSSSPPFVDTNNGVQFQGQGGVQTSTTNEQLNLTIDGEQAWLKSRTGNGIFTTEPGTNANTGLANSGSAWVTPGAVTDPSEVPYPAPSGASPTYTLQFKITGGVTTYDVLENGTATSTGNSFASGKAIYIPGKGMSLTVTGAPADGDTFVVGESKNELNMFTSLDRIIAKLNSSNESASTISQVVNSSLSDIDSVLSNMTSTRSVVGETLNRMDGIEGRIGTLKLAAQTEKSNAEDLDMTASISKFQNQQTGYQAALQSYAAVQKLSLFQYING